MAAPGDRGTGAARLRPAPGGVGGRSHAAKNQLHALLQSTTTPAVVLDDVRLSIHQYTAQIDALRDWADARISADEELAQVYRLLTGIPGIAAASAIQLMGELLVLPEDMRANGSPWPDWIRARAPAPA